LDFAEIFFTDRAGQCNSRESAGEIFASEAGVSSKNRYKSLMRIFREAESGTEGLDAAAVEELPRISANLSGVKAIVAIGSARGGVGKSALTVNVAATLALAGRKVGIVDCDLNSPTIAAMFGMKSPRRSLLVDWTEPAAGPLGLRIAASNFIVDGEPPPPNFAGIDAEPQSPSRNGIGAGEVAYLATLRRLMGQTRFGTLDLLLLDLAPGLEQLYRLLSLVQRASVVLVSQPSELAARAVKSAVEFAAQRSAAIVGLVENMAGFNCDGCHSVRPLLPSGGLASVAREARLPLLERLPFDPRFAETCDRGLLFVREYAETPLAKQLTALAHAIDRVIAEPHVNGTALA
jgi:ATP-binding protein involved in chromosome partitioning